MEKAAKEVEEEEGEGEGEADAKAKAIYVVMVGNTAEALHRLREQ